MSCQVATSWGSQLGAIHMVRAQVAEDPMGTIGFLGPHHVGEADKHPSWFNVAVVPG